MPIFSILRGVENAVIFAVNSVLVASRFVVELLVLPFSSFHRLLVLAFRALQCCARFCTLHHQFFRAVVFRRYIYSAPLPSQRLTSKVRL